MYRSYFIKHCNWVSAFLVKWYVYENHPRTWAAYLYTLHTPFARMGLDNHVILLSNTCYSEAAFNKVFSFLYVRWMLEFACRFLLCAYLSTDCVIPKSYLSLICCLPFLHNTQPDKFIFFRMNWWEPPVPSQCVEIITKKGIYLMFPVSTSIHKG